jgi:malate dehydrogenase (oxaloacetate-decarboxylating)
MSKPLDYAKLSLEAHKRTKGKLTIQPKMPLENKYDLSIAYTPGVAEPCKQIHKDKNMAYEYTSKGNMVAVISDGSAVLGLGNIGGLASMPVMEGKCALFKRFGGVDAIPIVLNTQDTEELIRTIYAISPSFGGINLEDIAAPKCFEVESRLKEICDIPVMHDDQHGTAVVTLAALFNALKLTNRSIEELRVVINGTGAAGISIIKLMIECGVKDVIMVDTQGIIFEGRENLTPIKREMAGITNRKLLKGNLSDALVHTDVFIGVSAPGVLNQDMIKTMNPNPMIFAMANPIPEIMPDEALEAGAFVVATGRSDFPNQINNVLAFPGLFRGILDARARNFTRAMFIAAARAIADLVEDPSPDKIIPDPFDPRISQVVANAVVRVAKKEY